MYATCQLWKENTCQNFRQTFFTLDVAQEFRKNSTGQQKRPLFGLSDYVMQLMVFDTI